MTMDSDLLPSSLRCKGNPFDKKQRNFTVLYPKNKWRRLHCFLPSAHENEKGLSKPRYESIQLEATHWAGHGVYAKGGYSSHGD